MTLVKGPRSLKIAIQAWKQFTRYFSTSDRNILAKERLCELRSPASTVAELCILIKVMTHWKSFESDNIYALSSIWLRIWWAETYSWQQIFHENLDQAAHPKLIRRPFNMFLNKILIWINRFQNYSPASFRALPNLQAGEIITIYIGGTIRVPLIRMILELMIAASQTVH